MKTVAAKFHDAMVETCAMTNDLTFFTNEANATLLDRFKSTLRGVQHFDVLVGYFRTSGFHLLQEAFANIEQIRILVGLNVDRQTFEVLETNRQQQAFDFQSSHQLKQQFADGIACEMEHSANSHDTEIGVAQNAEFAYEDQGRYLVNTLYFIPTTKLWLLGLLNSKVLFWFYAKTSTQIRGGFVRYFTQYVQQLPIPKIEDPQLLEDLVRQILVLKQNGATKSVINALEQQIDTFVYQLYGLTDAEIALVEAQVGR